MHFHPCRRQAIAAVLIALVPVAGCESEVNSSSVSTNASQVAGEADAVEKRETGSSDAEEDATSNSPEEGSALIAEETESSVGDSSVGDNVASEDRVSSQRSEETSADAAAVPPELSSAQEKADPSRFPGGIIPASPNAEPLPGGPRLLVPERNFRVEGRPPALRLNYDDLDLLKVLNMGDPLPEDVVEQFPEWLKELDGKTVRLRGFMYPAYQQMLSAFILTRDTGVCCFGPNPKVYYLVGVKLKEGTEVRYIENRPFDVVGTFHIEPRYVDGTWYQLYKISDATVID